MWLKVWKGSFLKGVALRHSLNITSDSLINKFGRLIISWGRRRSQGLDCSSIKMVRELGLERCELVRTLSTNGREEGGLIHSTRGLGLVSQWSSSGYAYGKLRTEEIK